MDRPIVLLVILFSCSILALQLRAQNPLFSGYADPAMRVFNGKMYMLVGKDKSPEIKKFNMPYWVLYSSSDLRTWKEECIIDPKDTYLGAGYEHCWAGDLAFKNGKVYAYLSQHGEATAVVVANKPSGPFVDVLKKPLLPSSMSPNFEYDPTYFKDDDGKEYLLYGRDGRNGKDGKTIFHYQIARLGDDLISLAETPRNLINSHPLGFGTLSIRKNVSGGIDSLYVAQDRQYLHKYNGMYYLSRDGQYETSKNIYGPYTNRRLTGQNSGHASFSEYNGQTYHAWSFVADPYGNRLYRQIMMCYVHYKNNGDMVDDKNFIKTGKYFATGVGAYNAKWDTIEAEWYFKKSENAKKKESPNNGFELYLNNGDFLNFPSVENLKSNTTINFLVSSIHGNCTIEIREGGISGKIIGTCTIPRTGSFTNYRKVSSKLSNSKGTANLFFVLKGGNGELVHLDSFNFF